MQWQPVLNLDDFLFQIYHHVCDNKKHFILLCVYPIPIAFEIAEVSKSPPNQINSKYVVGNRRLFGETQILG